MRSTHGILVSISHSQALDKLSRLNTPSPSRTSRSPLPPLMSSTSSNSGSTSRLTSHSHSYSMPDDGGGRSREVAQSGSETERESQHMSYSSDDQSATPPSSTFQAPSVASAPNWRRRRPSDSSPPPYARSRTSSPGPSTMKKRVSLALITSNDEDVTSAALAAVASLRQSPTSSNGKKSRQPLPREFRDSKRSSLDGRVSVVSAV
jgi:hypothetical protein